MALAGDIRVHTIRNGKILLQVMPITVTSAMLDSRRQHAPFAIAAGSYRKTSTA